MALTIRTTQRATPGFSRIESPSSGWYARVTRNGIRHSKWFADSMHGGKRRARAAATRWVREMRVELGPPMRNWNLGRRLRKRDQLPTGLYRKTEGSHDAFHAYGYTPDGRRRHTSYSVHVHGVQGARRLAEQARARWVRALKEART